MLNPLKALRAYIALSQVADTVQKGPKPGVYSSEFWTMVFSSGLVLYEGTKGVIPPLYSVYFIVGLSALYIIARFLLKHKGLTLPDFPSLDNPEVEKALTSLVAEVMATQQTAKDALNATQKKAEEDAKTAAALPG